MRKTTLHCDLCGVDTTAQSARHSTVLGERTYHDLCDACWQAVCDALLALLTTRKYSRS